MSKTKFKEITGEELGGLLSNIHSHIEHKDGTDDIVYYEKDILYLLKKLGMPKPIWKIDIDIKKFKAIKR